MVHLPHLGKLRREVKEEAVDPEIAAAAVAEPFHKRFRLAQQQQPQCVIQQWSTGGASVSNQHDFLDEPSPLGLRLKKSPSLVDLIQMKLVQAGKGKDAWHGCTSNASEKLKASNFPGSVLRIGTWEWVSRYEGDLVVKCYFAKHKLVWEVLDGGLKSKIEIQWSDICALKVACPENEPGTLEIVLSRQPLFYRETNPQPRKHTLWQATSDFTGGQASMHRRHFLQCLPGMMNKHVEKLVHCDPRLYSLSQKNDVALENPYFESRYSIFEDPEDVKCQGFEHKDDDDELAPQSFRELLSPHSASVLATQAIEEDVASGECGPRTSMFNWNGFTLPGISMSKSDIANHIGHHIYKQMYSGNLPAADGGDGTSSKLTLDDITRYVLSDSQITDSGDGSMAKLTFEELTRHLLNDSQIAATTDERMLMSRVNSLCSLIHRDSGTSQINPSVRGDNEMYERKPQPCVPSVGGDGGNGSLLPRQEPFGDLLAHLPRISSFPHFS